MAHVGPEPTQRVRGGVLLSLFKVGTTTHRRPSEGVYFPVICVYVTV